MSENTIKPFTMTTAGFITPMISGILSASSSGLIIYIIFRSQQKLSTTYHRIMALMSVFDISLSAFVALGTIMMPSDNVFPFAGPMLGNYVTCQAQGWLVTFGYTGATALNACLAWYFVCNITLEMDALKIRKRLEPVMYIYTLIIALFLPSFYLSKDLLNSTPYDSFCTIAPHTELCWGSYGYNWNNCLWGKSDVYDFDRYVTFAVYILLVQFILILVGMATILWTVYRNSKEMEALKAEENQTANPNSTFDVEEQEDSSINDDDDDDKGLRGAMTSQMKFLKYSRVLIFQALMYIGAYMLTWSLNFLSAQFDISSFHLDAANCVLFPLQGFWNLLIFVFDKAYLIRQGRSNISFYQAFKKILSSPHDTPVFFLSNLSNVVIEPRQHEFDEEELEEESEPDVVLSKIGSEFDDLSGLRGDFSLEMSCVSSSEKLSSTSVKAEGNARTNLLNARRSWMELRNEKDTVHFFQRS